MGGGGISTKFIFPLRVGSKISQSACGSPVGTNKLIGLNCKYVFPLLASLWDFTHTHTHTHRKQFRSRAHHAHITITTSEAMSQTEGLFIRALTMWVFEFGVGVRRHFNQTMFVGPVLTLTSRNVPEMSAFRFKNHLYFIYAWIDSAASTLGEQVHQKQVKYPNICQSTRSEHDTGRFTRMDT